MEKSSIKLAAQNRKAHHDYFVEDRYEAGIELFGTEVKSVRNGALNLKDSFCIIKDGQTVEKKKLALPKKLINVKKCKNPRCITSTEPGIVHIFKLADEKNRIYRCIYCEADK